MAVKLRHNINSSLKFQYWQNHYFIRLYGLTSIRHDYAILQNQDILSSRGYIEVSYFKRKNVFWLNLE